MHDAKNRELKVGDTILIQAKITELYPNEDYCNVSAESLYGRRPDGAKERFCAINTGVMLRANAGDENDLGALVKNQAGPAPISGINAPWPGYDPAPGG
jgi:hypothetical protein